MRLGYRTCFHTLYDEKKYLHNLPKLRTWNIDRSNEKKWLYSKNALKQLIHCRKYYGCRPHKWQCFLWKHLPKPNLWCIVWSWEQEELVSISMQTKLSTCVFNQGDIFTLNGYSLKLWTNLRTFEAVSHRLKVTSNWPIEIVDCY